MFKDKVLLITGGTGSFGNAVLNRFLDSEEKLTKDYLKSIEDMCYQRNKETFNDLKETSLNFLFENLGIER